MNNSKNFAERIKEGAFIITAEYLPRIESDGSILKRSIQSFGDAVSAVNISDNPAGVAMSSLAASVLFAQSGIEPIYQVVTRDRNRIAIQSDILGAASLGIGCMLSLSGYHQTLTDNPESANVYDIDSTQLIGIIKKMNDSGELLNGAKISGSFNMLAGAVANPYMRPLELNMLRLNQKVESGAAFIQTNAVFDTEEFSGWLDAVTGAGISVKTAIIASVLPLESAEEAEALRLKYTEFRIPDSVIERMKSAGDSAGQKKEGIAICAEIIGKIKMMNGLRGIHILSGGREEIVPEILASSGLSGTGR